VWWPSVASELMDGESDGDDGEYRGSSGSALTGAGSRGGMRRSDLVDRRAIGRGVV
jgi:hypothetical protein